MKTPRHSYPDLLPADGASVPATGPSAPSTQPIPAGRWRPPPRWLMALAALGLILAGLAAYGNSFSVPFLFDDDTSIFDNPTIRHLWPPREVLNPPDTGAPVTGRPVANISLALNYAWGGLHVEGYHAFNLAAHVAAALTLFGVLRRTLRRPSIPARYREAALPLAWLISLLWLVHPLLTEPVTYVVGRTEVLMGLFYLLSLYAFIRSVESSRPLGWQAAAFLCCLLGMGTKEVMASAPLMILLYDRTFVAGTFRGALGRRGGFHSALASTWILLAFLMAGGTRGGSTGFGGPLHWYDYLFTQFGAILRYLKLSIWPHPLIFDYGTHLMGNLSAIVACGAVVTALGLTSVVAFFRWPSLGFVGIWFFAILAPSSSIVPVITQTMAERRMYLALPSVVVLVVLGLYRWLGRKTLYLGATLAIAAIVGTRARNETFHSAVSIWRDTVEKWPDQARPYCNLGLALMQFPAQPSEAIKQFVKVVQLDPNSEAYGCLGSCLAVIPGHLAEAERAFKKQLEIEPRSAMGRLNYGILLGKIPGREAEAVVNLRRAVTMQTHDVSILAQAHAALGNVLVGMPGQQAEGIAEIQLGVKLFPDLADPHAWLGLALASDPAQRRVAVGELEEAVDLKPDSPEIRTDLGTVLEKEPGRAGEAIAAYEAALRLDPNFWQAHYDLGRMLLNVPGKEAEGIDHLQKAVRTNPENADAQTSLGVALSADPERLAEAVAHFEAAAREKPDSEDSHFNLGAALSQLPERQAEAAEQFRQALRVSPRDPDAHFRLGCALAGIKGRKEEALAEFGRALSINPALANAHYYSAVLLQSEVGRREEAIAHLESALQISPTDTDARRLLAKLSGPR